MRTAIPDYSGENRFSWASLSSGELLRKSEQIPVSDPELLRESADIKFFLFRLTKLYA